MAIEEEDSEMAKGKGASKALSSDITERKRMEEEIRMSEERYRHLFENLDDAAFLADAETGHILETNRQGEVLLGMSRNEIVGIHQSELHPPGKAEEYRQRFAAHVEKGRAVDYDGEVIRKDGTIIPVSIGASPLTIQGRRLVLGLFRDITDRKQMEQALQQSEEKLQTYLESAPDGVYINDLKGTFLYGNKKAEELTGYNRQELLGKSFLKLNLLPAKYLAKAGRLLALNAMGKPTGPDELELIKRDGSRIWVEITTTPIKQGEGKTEVIGFVRDITERKQAEEKIQQQNKFLSNILNSLTYPFYVVDANDYTINIANKAAKMGNLSENATCYALTHKSSKPCGDIDHVCPLEEVKKTKKPVVVEHIHYDEDGNARNVEVHGYPILDTEGNVIQMIEYCLDITDRKQMEQALADEATRRRILVDQSRDGIVILDQNGKVYEANQQFAEMLGYSPEEVAQLHVWDWDTQWTREQLLEMIQSIDAAGDHFETYHRRKDGTVYDVEISTNGAVCAGQKLVFCVCRDITERKRAEEELERQKAYFQQLFDNSPDAIAWLDDADKVVTTNKGFEMLFGYRAEEAKGRFINDIVVPEDRIKEASAMSRAALNHAELRKERVRKRKDGSLVDVDTFGYPIRFGNKAVGIFAIYSDISERKQAEEALQKSEEKYRTLFESKLDGMLVIDETMKPLLANKTAAEMFGFDSVEELLEVNIFDYIPPEERERALKIITKDMFEKDMRQVNEFRLRTKSGKEIWVSAVGALTEYEGKVAGLISLRDITERKQMEEQLVRSEKLAAIGHLASGVAHELRGPLGAIRTATFYVQRRLAKSDLPATEPKVLEFLDIIDGEVNIASNVISDLIDFSRVAKPTISPVNIGGIIEDALKHVPIPENVNLARDIDKSLLMVMVDAEQIQRVFVNVIFNAVEAMPQGGRLGIRAGSKGEFVEVEFTDTGYGIPKSAIDNIFDPLFTTKARGIGLGLAVCKSILERHGGGIGVKSKAGKGSTFTVSLPAQVI